MQLITHQSHLDKLPQDQLTEFIIKRFEQIVEESDGEVLPTIILVKPDDDITGPDYFFVGCDGLLSDLSEKHKPREIGFVRPYEQISRHEEIGLFELLLLQHSEIGYWILIPEAIVEKHPELKWVLTADELGGLSPPQPL